MRLSKPSIPPAPVLAASLGVKESSFSGKIHVTNILLLGTSAIQFSFQDDVQSPVLLPCGRGAVSDL